MNAEKEDILIHKCLQKAEDILGWGSSDTWTTQDFEVLSRRIQESTGVNLSVATLKRIWGKIKYDSRPTVTTLDAVARFAGFENWRAFRLAHEEGPAPDNGVPLKRIKFKSFVGAGVVIVAVGVSIFFMMGKRSPSLADPARFEFSSKKVVDEGVPNTVIFDYDASAAAIHDSVFIRQSWDKRLSRQVSRDDRQHTSIYYYPGFFQAKLVINQQVVKEHNLLIKTAGWLPMIEQKPVPVYFHETDARQGGVLQLDEELFKNSNIDLQPVTPSCGFYNIRDYGMMSSDLVLEAEVKNTYKEGSAACQYVIVRLQFEGPAIEIPLSAPGCVSELVFAGISGKKRDLSAFGCNFSEWVKVRCSMKDNLGEVFVNGKNAGKFKMLSSPSRLVGLSIRFQGPGAVNAVTLSRHDGEMVYEEQF